MSVPTVFADFNNADTQGRLRMNCVGTTFDFARLGLRLHDGLRVVVSDHDELEADAELVYCDQEHIWVAKIDWNAIRRVAPAGATRAS